MGVARNTTTRDRHRKQIARGRPPCTYEYCLYPGVPIDYEAHHHDPLAFQADHIIPVDKGGPDTLENKTSMHRACNRHKWNRTDDEPAWQTDRQW